MTNPLRIGPRSSQGELLNAALDVLGRIDPLSVETEAEMVAWAQAVATVALARKPLTA